MKKLIKKLVLWHCRNYRLNTPEKIFKHLSKHFDDYNYYICISLQLLEDKKAISERNFLQTKSKLINYIKLYAHEFGGEYSIFGGWWGKPQTNLEKLEIIYKKKQFLRFIAEKEAKK